MSAPHETNSSPDPLLSGAVLFLIFNRPAMTARVFEAIRRARPPRLYIAADGPRPDVPEDEVNTRRARAIAGHVDWPCEVRVRFRDRNLGCRRAVTDAIDWFFANESEGLILEDDCLPRPEFFRFCNDLLVLYRDNQRIASISGTCFHTKGNRHQPSFYFGKHFHCWGWATWKRAWLAIHPDRPSDARRRRRSLVVLSDGDRCFPPYWRGIEEMCTLSLVDSWAYRVSLSSFELWGDGEGPLHVIPRVNLVDNIGLGQQGTHASGSIPVVDSESMGFPLVIPESIVREIVADRWTDKHIFGVSARTVLRMRLSTQWQRLRRIWSGR